MAMTLKVSVLHVGDYQTGVSRSGGAWHRKNLQIFDPLNAISGTHSVFGDSKESLDQIKVGTTDFELRGSNRNGGNVEYTLYMPLKPIQSTEEKPKQ